MTWTTAETLDVQRERTARLKSTPMSRYVYANVTFSATNQDTDVALGDLKPQNPDDVRWIPVELSAAAVIYRDTTGTAAAWTQTHIKLRASATCTARLLLFIEA